MSGRTCRTQFYKPGGTARWCDKPADFRLAALDGSENDACKDCATGAVDAGARIVLNYGEVRREAERMHVDTLRGIAIDMPGVSHARKTQVVAWLVEHEPRLVLESVRLTREGRKPPPGWANDVQPTNPDDYGDYAGEDRR